MKFSRLSNEIFASALARLQSGRSKLFTAWSWKPRISTVFRLSSYESLLFIFPDKKYILQKHTLRTLFFGYFSRTVDISVVLIDSRIMWNPTSHESLTLENARHRTLRYQITVLKLRKRLWPLFSIKSTSSHAIQAPQPQISSHLRSVNDAYLI